jgi:hypothetical protein
MLQRRGDAVVGRRSRSACLAARRSALEARKGWQPTEHVDLHTTSRRRPAKPTSRCSNSTLLLGLWELMDLVGCHVDLNSVAGAIELAIGYDNHVATETEKATDFDSDRGDFPT